MIAENTPLILPLHQDLDKLREERVPAIALVTENGYHHFVVVKGFDGERVLIGDPASGTRAVTRAMGLGLLERPASRPM